MSFKPTSFHIVERETKQNLITWSYPTISDDVKTTIKQTCFSHGIESTGLFYYKRIGKHWIYIKQFIIKNDKSAAVVLTSHCYQPSLYEIICDLFARKYSAGYNGVDLVKFYLNIYIKNGFCTEENVHDTFLRLKDFPWRTDLKGLIKNLGIEVILIYNALLLKKQILVYHPNAEELQQCLASITRLMSLTKPEDMLQPLSQNVTEFKKNPSFYLTGTTNKNLLNQKNLCDVVVDWQLKTIVVSDKAKDYFHMSPLHKEVAQSMIQLSESEETEADVIDSVASKTSEIFKYLNTFTNTEGRIKIEAIEAKKLNKNLGIFLINLAKSANLSVI